jgi:hypothetical protein
MYILKKKKVRRLHQTHSRDSTRAALRRPSVLHELPECNVNRICNCQLNENNIPKLSMTTQPPRTPFTSSSPSSSRPHPTSLRGLFAQHPHHHPPPSSSTSSSPVPLSCAAALAAPTEASSAMACFGRQSLVVSLPLGRGPLATRQWRGGASCVLPQGYATS